MIWNSEFVVALWGWTRIDGSGKSVGGYFDEVGGIDDETDLPRLLQRRKAKRRMSCVSI